MSGTNSRWNLAKASCLQWGWGKVGFEVSELPSTNDSEHQVGEYKTRRLVSMLHMLMRTSQTRHLPRRRTYACSGTGRDQGPWTGMSHQSNHLVYVNASATSKQ